MARRIADDQRYVHFVTFSVYRRRNLLSLDQPKKIILGTLNTELARFQAKCVGFVIMHNHVHAMIWLPIVGQLSEFLHEWKRSSSRVIREWYQQQQSEYFQSVEFGDAFWQPKYYSLPLHTATKIEEKLNYMHLNPVRAGFVNKAVDWKWSSARWYELRRSVGVPIFWME
jgi:putative transposase